MSQVTDNPKRTLARPGRRRGGIFDLGSACGHNPDQSANPFQGQLPSVIFSRTPGKHSITIKAG